MNNDPLNNDTSLPTSWNYGSFYGNSRLYLNRLNISGASASKRQLVTEKELVNEDYYRALNEYKRIHKPKEEKKIINNDKALSVVLNDSPERLVFSAKDQEDVIVLPRETVYMIDRVVRQRTSRARLAIQSDFNIQPNSDTKSKIPDENYSNIKKTSKSVNYESIEEDYKDNSGQKRSSKSRDRSSASKQGLTFEEWYRYVYTFC